MAFNSFTDEVPEPGVEVDGKFYSRKDVRNLRDISFVVPISDNEWENCGENWMKPNALRKLIRWAAMEKKR